jgi:DNA-binding NtrC family response regulator
MKIFLVDDERILRVSLGIELRDAGHEVLEFAEAPAALMCLQQEKPALVITDIRMPEMDGIELLAAIKKSDPDVVVAVMTAHSSLDTAIQALKLGAYDYLVKPFRTDQILHLATRVNQLIEIKNDNTRLQQQISQAFDFSSFTGESPGILKIFDLVRSVANSNASILITGETGTGKEMLANIIHYNSSRAQKPFVKVSCAILSREVFESELFGHEKGAFTGADKSRTGRFESAHKGTLYLDDVDDIPMELQVKLLRVLQEKEVEPVGSNRPVEADVRIISSTKYDLQELIAAGRFRNDLFYRLNVIPVHIPPLRERKEDIPLLVKRFLSAFAEGTCKQFSDEATEVLVNYRWPGNVRELKNLVERLVLTTDGHVIELKNLPAELLFRPACEHELLSASHWNLEEILARTETTLLKAALTRAGGNKTQAAALLGIPLSTFRNKAAKYGLDQED